MKGSPYDGISTLIRRVMREVFLSLTYENTARTQAPASKDESPCEEQKRAAP